MAQGDYLDNYGNVITAEPPDPAETATAPAATQNWATVESAVRALYAQYGLTPSDRDIASDVENYLKYGPAQLQANLAQRASSNGQGGGFSWSDYGAPPSGFSDQYSAGRYTPPQFQEKFAAPTVDDLLKDPGYQARMQESQRGFERSAAAKGSILSGGFVGRALPRELQTLASNEYSNTFKRAFDTYQQRYGQFSDSANREANAFAMNEQGKLNQYQQRYTSYKDLVDQRRQAEEDKWRREMDLAQLGLGGAGAY